jgi:hypothetical protein
MNLDDDDRVVRDGESVRTPLFMKDHRPRFLRTSDAGVRAARIAARDARQTWIKDLSTAWKRTPHTDNGPDEELLRRHLAEPDEPDEDDLDAIQARRDRQWLEYRDRVGNAWRNPSGRTDPGAALIIEKRRQRYTYEAPR